MEISNYLIFVLFFVLIAGCVKEVNLDENNPQKLEEKLLK